MTPRVRSSPRATRSGTSPSLPIAKNSSATTTSRPGTSCERRPTSPSSTGTAPDLDRDSGIWPTPRTVSCRSLATPRSVTRAPPRDSPLWLTATGLAKRIVPTSLPCWARARGRCTNFSNTVTNAASSRGVGCGTRATARSGESTLTTSRRGGVFGRRRSAESPQGTPGRQFLSSSTRVVAQPRDVVGLNRRNGPLSSVDPMSAIDVSGLVRRYGEYTAIDGLDLTVATGECVAILGPNGAGKTTVVEILEGYRKRDEGDVRVLDVDPARAERSWRQRIGIVLQSTDDLADITVTESLEQFARFYDSPRAVPEVIELVGLSKKAKERAGQLSGGQRRRLDVALGVIGRPELLFLDEPTTGFDPEARHVFWQLIERLKSEGVTILLTTHYLEEADALADRVVVIARGKKVADTTPADLGSRNQGIVIVRWHDGTKLCEERTDTPTETVRRLSATFAGEIASLEIIRPTLEQAYLELVDGQSP